ncbi:MAG: hypothetical protein JWN01_490 [Patescibacteria group bacterium]|nr:hypothetical protein [Patescibacteria group bacterium]
MLLLCYVFYFIAATLSPLQRRKLSLTSPTSGYTFAFAFRTSLVVGCLGLLLPFFSPAEFKGESSTILVLAFASGIFGTISITSQYWAQKHVEAGTTILIGNIYTPVTIILASLLLREGLTPLQAIGTLLLLAAMIVVSKKHHLGKQRFDKYFLTMLLSGIALGIALTAERALINTTGFTTGTLLSWWAQVLTTGIAALLFETKTAYTLKETLITGTLRFFQLLSWVLLVYAAGNISLVSAVTTFKVVIIFVFAAIFLHEREDLTRKIIGSLIAVGGMFLLKMN